MSMNEERTVSLWMAAQGDRTALVWPGLSENLSAEIVIIGAGISGLSAAYALSRAGKTVVVLDDGDIGGGNTARTTAHLSNVIDDRFVTLRRERGADIARIAATSHGAAIDFIERVQAEEGIACGFKRVDGYLLLGEGDSEAVLDDEMNAAREAGLEVEKLPHPPAPLPDVPCLRFSNQAHFNPLAYVAGLAGAVERHGGRIFSGAHVTGVEDGEPVKIDITGGHQVTAATAIVATASPINDTVRLHTKMAPYRTYAVAGPIDPQALPDALIWDTKDPYHYVRLAEIAGTTYAIFGGEDHKTGQSESESGAVERLERWARAQYPIETIDHRWSGQVMETIDGLGFIGLNPGDRHVYVVTGDSGMGITHGTIAGILLPALIETGEHAWKDTYDPARTPVGSAATFIAENANVAKQFVDFLTPSDVGSFDDIAVGEGAVMRHGVSKIAVFRDDRGKLHVRSAVCPHLGCIVQWNGLEKVWDCPCHGSQFAATGHVLHGPSTAPLPTVDDFNQDRNPNIAAEAKDADGGRPAGS